MDILPYFKQKPYRAWVALAFLITAIDWFACTFAIDTPRAHGTSELTQFLGLSVWSQVCYSFFLSCYPKYCSCHLSGT